MNGSDECEEVGRGGGEEEKGVFFFDGAGAARIYTGWIVGSVRCV